MDPNKAPGPDGIPVKILRQAFKNARIRVLKKLRKPDYSNPGAYRPISLLCTMGKVFEAVIARRISYLVETKDILPDSHY